MCLRVRCAEAVWPEDVNNNIGTHCQPAGSAWTSLRPEIEAQFVAEAHAKGVEPSVYAGSMIERVYLLANGARRPSRNPEEVRAWLDSLAQFSDKIPQLPDEAFTRESFYQGHE